MGEDQIISLRGLNLRYCTAALLLLCSIFNCKAQSADYSDLGSWLAVSVSRPFNERFSATVRLEQRTKDDFQGLNQIYSRASIYYKPSDWLRIDQQFDWAYTPSGNRIRYVPGLRVSHKTERGISMYLRQWYMHTWYPGQSKASVGTLRTKAGLSHPVGEKGLTPHLDYEIFYWDAVSQHRFYAGARVRLSKETSLDLFYLYQLFPIREYGLHVTGINLAISLP